MNNKVALIGGIATLALAASASAEIKLTDNLSVSGYGAGSFQHFDVNNASDNRLDIDQASIDFNFKKDLVSAKLGLFYTPGITPDELTLLDANLTYDLGDGHSVTGGKYLSWLGYEPFHTPGRNFVTPNLTTLSIPGYRSGVKYTYTSSEWNGGVGLSDSEFATIKGDGEIRSTYGLEGFVSYTGVKDLTIFAGLGYENSGPGDIYLGNIWASYNLSSTLSVATEYVYTKDESANIKAHNFLTEAKYKIDDKAAVAGRLTYQNRESSNIKGYGAAIAPSYKVSENLEVRSEVGYTDFDGNFQGDSINFAVQAVFTF